MEAEGTDSPGGHHPNQTNGNPTPQTPQVFTGRMPFLPPNQIWRLTLSFGCGSLAGAATVQVHQNRPNG